MAATTKTESTDPKLAIDARGNLCLDTEVEELNAKYKKEEAELEKILAEREKIEAKKNK